MANFTELLKQLTFDVEYNSPSSRVDISGSMNEESFHTISFEKLTKSLYVAKYEGKEHIGSIDQVNTWACSKVPENYDFWFHDFN